MKNLEVFRKMTSCEKITITEMGFDTFGECNNFLLLMKDMKTLRFLEMDYYILDMFFDIAHRVKLLTENMKFINGYDWGFAKPKEEDEEIDMIIRDVWKIASSYRLSPEAKNKNEKVSNSLPVWYIMDEVGLSVNHNSENPNVTCLPFLYFKENIDKEMVCTPYNLMWPIQDLVEENFITRDHTLGQDEDAKKVKMGLDESCDLAYFEEAYNSFDSKMTELKNNQSNLFSNYNFGSSSKIAPSLRSDGSRLKIVTDDKIFKDLMKANARYDLVNDVEDADFCWFKEPIESYLTEETSDLIKSKMNNQFKISINSKSDLFETVQSVLGYTNWLPLGFKLDTQVKEFASFFLHNKTFG